MLTDYIKALGKEIKWHGRTKDEAAHYCVNCEVRIKLSLAANDVIYVLNFSFTLSFFLIVLSQLEVFNLLFVKEVEKKKFVVHCIDCARKISNVLEGFVILEEYTKDDLIETYDSFALFTPTNSTSTPNASIMSSNNLT